MQHMVSLVQLGVGPEDCVCWWCVALQCNTPAVQHATNTHTPQDRHLTTPRTPYAVHVRNYNIHRSWRWACKPETCRAESTQINTQLRQVGKLIYNSEHLLVLTRCDSRRSCWIYSGESLGAFLHFLRWVAKPPHSKAHCVLTTPTEVTPSDWSGCHYSGAVRCLLQKETGALSAT